MTTRNRGPRRKREWMYDEATAGLAIGVGAITKSNMLTRYNAFMGLLQSPPGLTVGPIFGSIHYEVPSDKTASLDFRIGIAAAVDPPDDGPWENAVSWMYLHRFNGTIPAYESSAGVFTPGSRSIDVETRSMRKLDQGKTLWIVFENAGDDVVQVRWSLATLGLLA